MTYARTWSIARPAGSLRAYLLDDEIRYLREDMAERLVDLLGVTMADDPMRVVKIIAKSTGLTIKDSTDVYTSAKFQNAQAWSLPSAIGNLGATPAIDLDVRGNVFTGTLNAACAPTFTNFKDGGNYQFRVLQDATGGRVITWPSNVEWPGNVAPTVVTTANTLTIYVFTSDGTKIYGGVLGTAYVP